MFEWFVNVQQLHLVPYVILCNAKHILASAKFHRRGSTDHTNYRKWRATRSTAFLETLKDSSALHLRIADNHLFQKNQVLNANSFCKKFREPIPIGLQLRQLTELPPPPLPPTGHHEKFWGQLGTKRVRLSASFCVMQSPRAKNKTRIFSFIHGLLTHINA